MTQGLIIYGIVAVITLIGIGIGIIADRFRNPFQFPVIRHEIEISGRRQLSYEDCIDQWIIDNQNYDSLKSFNKMLADWDKRAETYLERTWFWKGHKTELYRTMRHQVTQNDYQSFEFVFSRSQTRYRQQNYQKTSYKVQNVEHIEALTLSEMLAIDGTLEEIDYETTREKYFAKNQRKLMTKELRRSVIERDNWTCQICGKYMPDEVGLHVDHKVSIKKGGRTIPSNLQVACDKCNLSKGSKK